MFLAVDVNLLPADYTPQDFEDNTQVTLYMPCPTFPLVCAYIVEVTRSFRALDYITAKLWFR